MLLPRVVTFLSLTFVASVGVCTEPVSCEYPDNPLHASSLHKECLAKNFPEFVDYFLNIPSCTLVISMTKLEDVAELEAQMRPSFAGFGKGIPAPPCPSEGDVNIEFRRLEGYSYAEIAKWAKQVQPLIHEVVSDRVANVLIMDGQFSIFVQTDAAMNQILEIIEGLQIPKDAYTVGSRETEIREMPSIAPTVRVVGDKEQVLLPVYLWNNEKVMDLVLGETVLAETEDVLPPWPGHGPYRQSRATPRQGRSPWISDEMNDAIDTVRVNHMPAQTFLALAFDGQERLILAQYEVQEGQGDSLVEGISDLAPLEEIHMEGSSIISRATISPCVVADVGTSKRHDGEYRVAVVTYVFTCKLP